MIVRPVAVLLIVACGGSPPPAPVPTTPVLGKQHDLTELEQPARPPLLAIDWATVKLDTPADALPLWARIAPTGLDWDDKLDELPDHVERPLALALIEGGNFTCMPPVPKRDCAPPQFDVDEPRQAAGFTDPCLRRLLAMWALDKLDAADLPRLRDPLRAIVSIPPPESELVAAALLAVPEDEHAFRLDLLAHAWRAGQHDLVNGGVGKLTEPFLIEAVTKHHLDGALEILSAEGHRATYLAAVTDEQLGARARTRAMQDLVAADGKPAPDLIAALAKATAAKDCTVAAIAARLLAQAGDPRFVPRRPKTANTPDKLMRALCVLASYEQQQGADGPSLLASYVPRQGLEQITISYDPLGEVDDDGDGDPHTRHDAVIVPAPQLAFPEIDDAVKAFASCSGTICKSEDRELRFVFKRVSGQLVLTRLEIADRPPCPKP